MTAAASSDPIASNTNLVALSQQLWQLAVRKRLFLASILFGCLILAAIITALMPPHYTARTQIEVSREKKNITNVAGLDSPQESRDLEFYSTQYALLQSESLAERVARRLKLAESNSFLEDNREVSAAAPDEKMQQVTRQLLRNVAIRPVRSSRLIDIEYTSTSPQLATQVANTWVQEFIRATMDRQLASTIEARQYLEENLANLRTKVESSERDVVVYSANRGIVPIGSEAGSTGKIGEDRLLATADLVALNQELATAKADRISAQSRAGKSRIPNDAEALTNPVVASLRAKRAEAAAEHARILVQFEPAYPAAQALQQQIASLDAAIARELGRVSDSRGQAYREAQLREETLQRRVDQLKQDLSRQRQDMVQYNTFQREADTNQQLYNALLQRYKEIGIAGNIGASNIAVVDPAKIPTRQSSPSLLPNLLLGLLIGLAIGSLALLVIYQLDEGVREPAEVTNLLQTPLLGSVPMISGTPVDALDNPQSPLSEAYFGIATMLGLTTSKGIPASLAITSAGKGDGKSTTAISLASSFGRSGRRVLLIDGDMRSPSINGLLGIDNRVGLSNLLAGELDLAEAVRATSLRNLSVITSGPLPPSPPELLDGERLAQLLAKLGEQFDHIVIDTPPSLGLSDAMLIGHATQGLVFVIQSGVTSRKMVSEALDQLRSAGRKVYGAVLSKVEASGSNYGYN